MHGRGSLGTNVLCTIVARLLCWAGIGPHINRIATEIRTALMLRLLRRCLGIAALLRLLFTFPKAARVSEDRWPENKTLTRIRMPKHGLAFTPIADCDSCRCRGLGGWDFLHRTGGGCRTPAVFSV